MKDVSKNRIATGLAAALLTAGCTGASSESVQPSSSATPATTPTSTPVATIDDGRILFAIESGDAGTSVPGYIDATGYHEIEMAEDGSFAHAVWGPDDQVVFDSERDGPRHLFRMPLSGGEAIQLTDGPVNQSGPEVAPDGDRVAYEAWSSDHDLGLFSADMAGGGMKPILLRGDAGTTKSGYLGFTEAAYSPDGRWIAFTRVSAPEGAQSGIFVVRTDGAGLRRLTSDAMVAAYPRWSPDGTTILFQQNLFEHDEGGSPLWTVPFEGGKPQPLMHGFSDDQWASEGDWSPDGTQIVFKYYETGWDHNELRIMNADGTDVRTLWVSDPAHTAETPDWGP